ncbi:MAG: sulfatase [Lentisphaerae bacterium]|nr:sulfatase [Planctomycetota bacterium]MBM4143622.1 sulfatase [Lentisphaerota bacterium]
MPRFVRAEEPGARKGATGKDAKPNIVFILADDLGWKDTACMGSHFYKTPRIDQLAAQGMIFSDAYANAPNCAPTRACLLTGLYSPRHGVYTVGASARGRPEDRKLIPTPNTEVLDPRFVTIAEALKSAGYATASIGKWHLGQDPKSGPQAQGFDVNIGGNQSGAPKSYFSPYGNPDLPDGPKGEYVTDRLGDEAVNFIKDNRQRPFFLYLPHFAVHTPHQAKPELIAQYKGKPGEGRQRDPTYAAMIESLDQSVGRVLDCLDTEGLADNTVVVFFSDNGGFGPITDMTPLRGSKGMLYEGGIREPTIVRWPGRVKPGSTCDTPIIGVDFFPTLLEIAGAKAPTEQPRDGVSLLPVLAGGAIPPRDLFWHEPVYLEAYEKAQGRWRCTPSSAIRGGDWKLIEFFEDNHVELYNLKDDIGETTNLAEKLPEKAQELRKRLAEWRQAVNAPVPTQLNPRYQPDASQGKAPAVKGDWD